MAKAIVPKKKRRAAVVKKVAAKTPRRKAAPAASRSTRPTLRKPTAAPAKKKTTSAKETVEQQILRVTESDPCGKSETMEQYTLRLAEAVDSKPEYWKQLDADAKAWFKSAVKAINKDEPPPAFEEDEGADDADQDKEGEEGEEGEAEEGEEEEEVEEAGEEESDEEEDAYSEAMGALVGILADDPDMTEDTAVKKAKRGKIDLTEEAVRIAHPIIVSTIQALDEAGRLK